MFVCHGPVGINLVACSQLVKLIFVPKGAKIDRLLPFSLPAPPPLYNRLASFSMLPSIKFRILYLVLGCHL